MARVIEITTPLGADVLLFHRMRARAETSRLFEYEIDLLSRKADVDLDKILAANVTVNIELPEGKTRHFNGFVTRFALRASPLQRPARVLPGGPADGARQATGISSSPRSRPKRS